MIERYKSANQTPQQSTFTGGGSQAISQVATQNIESLGTRLEQFKNYAFGVAKEDAAQEAQKQAAMDDVNGKEFHQESVYTAYGKAYNNSRSASYAANAELDLSKKSDELALEFQNDPQGYREAYGSYVEGMIGEAPTPEIKSVIGITGRKVKNHTFGKLSVAKDAEIKNTQVAEYDESTQNSLGQIINAMASGDTKTADLIRAKWEKYSETLMLDGALPKAAYLKVKDDAEYQIKKGVMEKQLEDLLSANKMEEAGNFVGKFNEKIPKDLGPVQYNNIQSSLNTLYSKKLKQNKANTAVTDKYNKNLIGENIKLFNKGEMPNNVNHTDELIANSDDPVLQRKYGIAKGVQSIVSRVGDLTLQEIEQVLNNEKANMDTTDVMQVGIVEGLEKHLNDKKAKAMKDPISLGQEEGINVQPLTLEDLSGLPTRILQAKHLRDIYQTPLKVLTDVEATQATAFLNSKETSAADKQAYISQIAQLAGEDMDIVLGQIAKKGGTNFAFAGHLSTINNPQASQVALQGFGSDIKVDVDLTKKIQEKLAGVFVNADNNNLMLKGIQDYIKGKTLNGEEVIDVNSVLEETIGSIQVYNGRKTLLPYGMSEDDFEDKLDNIVIEGRPKLQENIRDLTDLSVWSGKTQLHYQGNGKYYVYNPNNGNGYYELADDGETPYVLEIK